LNNINPKSIKTIFMKKILLTMVALVASTMVANAGKVAFVVADNTYTDTADQVVILPSGFCGGKFGLTSDAVNLSGFTETSTNPYVTSGTFRWYSTNKATVTPAKGVTITKMKVTVQGSKYSLPLSDEFTVDGLTQTSTTPHSEAFDITYVDTTNSTAVDVRITVIEIEYEGTPAVAQPRITTGGYDYILPADQKITLTTPTEGAKIYYTLDGTEPTDASTLYAEPFTIDETAYVRAIAVTDDGTSSFVATKGFVSVPAGVQIATYNFTDMSSLNVTKGDKAVVVADTWEADGTGSANSRITLGSTWKITADKTSMTDFAKNGSTKYGVRLYKSNTFGDLTQFRLYNCNISTYNVTDDDYYLVGVVHVGGVNTGLGMQDASNTTTGITTSDDNGSIKYAPIYKYGTSATSVWLANEGVKNSSLTLMVDKSKTKDGDTQFFQQVYILYAPKDSGDDTNAIENVAVDNNAPVEFFNLQGVRVANPTPGAIYVKRQGNSATKVLLK
jgi:hypothetical protein